MQTITQASEELRALFEQDAQAQQVPRRRAPPAP